MKIRLTLVIGAKSKVDLMIVKYLIKIKTNLKHNLQVYQDGAFSENYQGWC